MEEPKDSLTITLTLNREINGSVSSDLKMVGEGFRFFEIIGLLEIIKSNMVESSKKIGDGIPQDGLVRFKFEE